MGYTLRTQKKSVMDKDYIKNVVMTKSNHSYMINNKITKLLNKDSWLNKRCFIIGGGESLKNFDFTKLNKELTIGINKAFYTYPISTINYSMDSTLYNDIKNNKLDKPNEAKHWDKWMNYRGIKVFATPLEFKEFGKEVYLVRRNIHKSLNRQNLDDGIYVGMNSGLGAICLAVALGANEIYLLGYDMQCKEQSHFHNGYDARNLNEFNLKLNEYKQELTSFKTLLDIQNIKVVNLNPNSNLTCFEFGDITKVLGE